MALESTPPLTEMSCRNLPGAKWQPGHKADKLTAICEPTVYKIWEPRRLTSLRASWPITGIALPLVMFISMRHEETCNTRALENSPNT
jgi:hypothetical protein